MKGSFIIFILNQILLGIRSERMRWVEHVARMGMMRNEHKI